MDRRTYELFQNQDWDSLGRQLLVFALRQARRYYWRLGSEYEPMPGQNIGDRELVAGWTVQDIVQHVIDKACRGKRKWDPDKGELLPWLKWQVKSVTNALAKSRFQKREGTLIEPEDDETEMLRDRLERRDALIAGRPETVESMNPEAILLEREEQERARELVDRECDLIYQAVSGDPELEAIADAISDGHGPKRKDIAAALGITPEEVTNRKKRIQRRLAKLQAEDIEGKG